VAATHNGVQAIINICHQVRVTTPRVIPLAVCTIVIGLLFGVIEGAVALHAVNRVRVLCEFLEGAAFVVVL
jgi:uncharacterized membrane protein YdjX (TVP38/TMEM64 family)